jgi:hypothetical protein
MMSSPNAATLRLTPTKRQLLTSGANDRVAVAEDAVAAEGPKVVGRKAAHRSIVKRGDLNAVHGRSENRMMNSTMNR